MFSTTASSWARGFWSIVTELSRTTPISVTRMTSIEQITPAIVIAQTRGTIRVRILSTPSTSRASSSSRIRRVPRSPASALPITPATTMKVSQVESSRTRPT